MKIIDVLKEIGINSNDVKKLNKSLDMMTCDELRYEYDLGIKKLNKTGKLDNRTKEIMEFLFQLFPESVEEFLTVVIKNKELVPELIKHFSKYLDEECLESLIKNLGSLSKNIEDDKDAKKEARLNKLKYMCNRVTSRFFKKGIMEKNPLSLELKHDELNRIRAESDKLRDEAYEVLFLENYDRIDWQSFIQYKNFEVIKNIYNKLPTQIKEKFLFLCILERDMSYFSEEEVKKMLLEIEDIKYKLLEYLKKDEYKIGELCKIIGIISEDIKKYYRTTGIYPKLGYWIFNEVDTAEEYIKDLKCIREEYRNDFIKDTYLPIEEEIKLIDSKEIDDTLRIHICGRLSFPLENGDAQKKYYYTKVMENTESEIIKNDCNIAIAVLDAEYSKILSIIKTGKYTFETLIVSCDLLEFSDEEIKEIYNTTEDLRLKEYLLGLKRRKDDFTWNSLDEWDFNSRPNPEYIIINKENYFELLKKAKSYEESSRILTIGYDFDFSLEQNLEIFRIIRERNEIRRSVGFNRVIEEICSKMTVETLPQIIELGVFEHESLEQQSNIIVNALNLDNFDECVNIIINLDNVELKRELLDRLIDKCSYHKEYFFNFDKVLGIWLNKEDVNIEDKYILLSKIMKLNLYYGKQYDKEFAKEFYEKFSTIFRKLNEESKMEEYSEILDFNQEYEKDEDGRCDIIWFYNIADSIQYLCSEIVYNKVKKIYSKNKNVKKSINPALLSEGVISELDDDAFEFLSRYDDNMGILRKIFENEKKRDIFVSAYKRLGNIKTFCEEDILEIAKFIEMLEEKELISISEQDIDLIIAIALSKDMYNEFSVIAIEDNESRLEKYIETTKRESYKKIHDVHCTKRQAIDAIARRYFGLSYLHLKEIVDKYATDVEEFIKYYKEKSELTVEEENELEALIILRNFKEILSIDDKNALIEVFDELEKLGEFNNIDFSLSIVLDENIRRAFAKEYKEKLYQLNENDRIESIDGIAVYSPKEFNLLVHVVAAYGNFKLIDEENLEKSAKEFWNNPQNKKNHILCTSYINNSNLCYAKPKKKDKSRVIFGFVEFGDNSLLMASPYDLASNTTSMHGDESQRLRRFMMAKNMVNNTRWQYNEVDLERRLENEKGTDIQPDYIVCVDAINDESKKIAKDFGIPIIFLDTREIAKNESKKLEALFEKFYQTMEPSIIEEIIVLYHTNVHGLFEDKQKLIRKYFSPFKMNENLQKIINFIDKEYEIGDRKKAIKCYEVLNKALNNEININMKMGQEAEKEVKGEKVNLREYRNLTSQKIKRIKKESRDFNRVKNVGKNSEDRVFAVVSRAKERSIIDDR